MFLLRNIQYSFSLECPIPQWRGNGICEDANNIAACNFDGGDCCLSSTCINTEYCSECLCHSGPIIECKNIYEICSLFEHSCIMHNDIFYAKPASVLSSTTTSFGARSPWTPSTPTSINNWILGGCCCSCGSSSSSSRCCCCGGRG